MDLIITILPVVTKDLPISARFFTYSNWYQIRKLFLLYRCQSSTIMEGKSKPDDVIKKSSLLKENSKQAIFC